MGLGMVGRNYIVTSIPFTSVENRPTVQEEWGKEGGGRSGGS